MPRAPSKPRRAKRREPLTRERVLRAAIEMADAEGIDALSMRKLAQALGVEAMSLYNHVANKDEVLDAITDLVVGEIKAPVPGTEWKRAMRERAFSAHAVLMAHPWASMLIVSRMNIGPAMLHYVDATIGTLREGGFSFQLADHAWTAIDSHIYGFTMQKQNFPLEVDAFATAAEGFLPKLPAETYPYMHALTEGVAKGTHDGVPDFTFGLELLLDGLEALLARSPR